MPNDRRAIVVEDDPEIRAMLRRYLNELGLDVSEAGTGRSAEEAFAGPVPDLICLDLMLPETSGYTLCERIRKNPRLATVPVLVISARATPEDRANAEEVGASAYLIKPVRRAEFRKTVQELLGA